MSSASFQVLRCTELVSKICGHLAPGSPDPAAFPRQRLDRRVSQATLARLARVCSAFTGPALDVLWEVLEDLVPLISIIAAFSQPTSEHPQELLSMVSEHAFEADWTRFREYARRVRVLYLKPTHNDVSGEPSQMIPESVWALLAEFSPSDEKGLLPNLRRLESLEILPHCSNYDVLLLPSLRHLSVSTVFAQANGVPDAFLDTMQTTIIPHLKSLRSSHLFDFGPSDGSPFGRYAYLSHLQTLEIVEPITDEHLLRALPAFPNLRELTLQIGAVLPAATQLLHGSFGALRKLTLAADIVDLNEFLQVMAPPQLEALTLRILGWTYDDHGFDAPGLGFAHSALSKVTPSITQLAIYIPSDCPRAAAILEPALAFRWLTTITIVTAEEENTEVVISDADLRAFAAAWPHLVEFELAQAAMTPMYETELIDCPTARTLMLFAEQHPRLIRLALPFLGLRGDAVPAVDEVPRLDHGLQCLRIGAVEEVDLRRQREFVFFLDRLFPNLDLSDPADVKGEEVLYYTAWSEVEQLLVMLQAGRRQAMSLSR